MIAWRDLPADLRLLYSPIGLLLVDDLTGRSSFGAIDAILELQGGAEWREVVFSSVVTASGILIFPGLGRSVDVTQPPQRYRVRLRSALYRPLYQATVDGIEFDVPPYNDTSPPAMPTNRPTRTVLLPAANYPYAAYLPVVRGTVEDSVGNPLPDVLVQESMRERTITDGRGAFSLSMRWVPVGAPAQITADDLRGGRSGAVTITLPGALDKSQTITVT